MLETGQKLKDNQRDANGEPEEIDAMYTANSSTSYLFVFRCCFAYAANHMYRVCIELLISRLRQC